MLLCWLLLKQFHFRQTVKEVMAVWSLGILCGVALLAVKVDSGCELGNVDVVEDSDRSFTCNVSENSRLEWAVYNDKRETIFLISCSQGSCKPPGDKLFEIYFDMWVDYYKYTLKIKSITRNSARILSCNNSVKYSECELKIIDNAIIELNAIFTFNVRGPVKPVYTKGDCSVSISNWMVIGSCTVKRMYSSDNNYTCKWRISKNIEEFGGFQTTPTSYTEHNGRNYYKGVCSFAKPIPTFQSCYTYSMSLSPGTNDYFNETKCTDTPYQVQLSHNCPEYVFEGSDVHCECNASRTISSPALLVWEGMDDSTLLLTNVSRRLNQRQFTCRLQWSPDGSIKETTSYKLNVAYGPGDALITETTTDESQMISLTCTATDVYPTAEIRWNITCSNQTDYGDSSTCFLNFTHNGGGLVILCTASNAHFPREYKSRVYVLSSIENNQANTARANGGVVGGVIVAVVIIIIVSALIAFIIKRRKEPGLLKPHAVIKKPLTQTPKKRQVSPSGDMYTITNTTSSGHVVDDYAMVSKNTGGIESKGSYRMIQVLQSDIKAISGFETNHKAKATYKKQDQRPRFAWLKIGLFCPQILLKFKI